MVKSTGWAAEKTMIFGKMRHWFPKDQPVTQVKLKEKLLRLLFFLKNLKKFLRCSIEKLMDP
jgi:hypothetical protein